jgi:hypothetical protein
MMSLEKVWQRKSDRALERAAKELANYNAVTEQVIRAELQRRGMPNPPPFLRIAHDLTVANQETADYIQEQVLATHQSHCPRCSGPGPVDIHTAHWVWSIIFLTQWKSQPQLSCRSCGRSEQIKAILTSAVVGWWGFPWGLLITPVQIIKNFSEISGGPKDTEPSKALYVLFYKQLT